VTGFFGYLSRVGNVDTLQFTFDNKTLTVPNGLTGVKYNLILNSDKSFGLSYSSSTLQTNAAIPTPEPSTLTLAGIGTLAFAAILGDGTAGTPPKLP
jgi:hypothetical protein